METAKEIIKGIVAMATVLIPAYWLHNRELKKLRKERETYKEATKVLDSLLNLKVMYIIRKSAERIFRKTEGSRFLILIAFNGQTDFRFVSAIYEEHDDPTQYKAVDTYNHITSDPQYKAMLKRIEQNGVENIDVEKMEPCMLKDFYQMEGVKHSKVTFLLRHKVNEENDVVIFSSVASLDRPFTSRCRTIINLTYQSVIIPEIRKYLGD